MRQPALEAPALYGPDLAVRLSPDLCIGDLVRRRGEQLRVGNRHVDQIVRLTSFPSVFAFGLRTGGSQGLSDGRMPRPKIIDKRKTWDRYALDAAYADLPNEGDDMSGWADFQSAVIGNGYPKA